MEINRAAIKANAKFTMSGAKPNPMLVALICIVINFVLVNLSNSMTGQPTMWQILNSFTRGGYPTFPIDGDSTFYDYYTSNPYGFASSMAFNSLFGLMLVISISIMTTLIQSGFVIYALKVSRSEPAGIGNLFDGFGIFLRIIALVFIEGIFIFLWSLLLVIPGIIAAYRYRQSLYILLDNPHMSPLDCISASKELMIGRKGELFVLDLSFIGWYLLTIIPFVSVWVLPYTEVTFANYYNALLMLPREENQNEHYM